MYERSAIVLERYFYQMLGLQYETNFKTLFEDYEKLVNEIEKYQKISQEEETIINEFDNIANDIRRIQQEQKEMYKSNIKLENERNQLFEYLDEEPDDIEKKLKNIESKIKANNNKLEQLREEFVNTYIEFRNKQQNRNKYSRKKREEEKTHIQLVKEISKNVNEMNEEAIKVAKNFSNTEEFNNQEIVKIMLNNGKDERIPFDKKTIEKAVDKKIILTKKEAEIYLVIYEKTKKLLTDIDNDDVKIEKYKKILRDSDVKLAFLDAQNKYIINFLDNERLTIINGPQIHKKLMKETCDNFDLDMEQFDNLYEIILYETTSKATKKIYNELYNKQYLKNIEEKEKNFEKEVNNLKIKSGTIINLNYWRVQEIKNIYNVFLKEVTEKFNKDLSDLQIEKEDIKMEEREKIQDKEKAEKKETKIETYDIFSSKVPEEDIEYIDEYDYDDDYEEVEELENEELDEENNNYEEYLEDDEEEYEYEEDDEYYDEDEEEEDEEYYDEEDETDDDENEEISEDINENKKRGLFNKFFKN